MLDLIKIAGQMSGMSDQMLKESKQTSIRLQQAQTLFAKTIINQQKRSEQRAEWQSVLAFTCASPVEPLANITSHQPYSDRHTVIATDGSQIAPSRHEIAYCYLINIGRVALHYGCGSYPLLDSIPEIYYQFEDLYIARKWNIQTEEWMGLKRTLCEAIALNQLAQTLLPSQTPILALSDGSLIHWNLETYPAEVRAKILPEIIQSWQQLQQAQIPMAGYISAPRTVESTNFLRLEACPYNEPNCSLHCANQPLEQNPCSKIMPLRDALIWQELLKPGECSPLWRSHSRILQEYENHWIYFCYLHVGTEIARIEMPEWTALDPDKRSLVISIILAQIQKGYGYPVSLAEAHNQAVVTGSDRRRFFALLEQQMLQSGIPVTTTAKESRKRSSIA
jgi:NurA domain